MKALNIGKAWIVATLTIFSVGFAQAQVNDPCTGALPITCGQTLTGDNNAATNDVTPACGLSAPRKGVWYTITGTGGMITLTTCSATSNFDTQISIYSGACTALVCVASNDNDPTCTNYFNRLSRVSFASTFGTVYRIMVSGKLSAHGTFTLAATCAVVAPPNDDCANSILTTCGSTVTGSTVGSTIDAVGTCTTALNTAGGVWYRFVSTGGSTTVSLCGSGYDTKIGIFTGSCAALTCVAGNDDFCGLQSQVTFAGTAGTTYYVLVTGFGTNVGNFTLAITCTGPPPPNDNDLCDPGVPIIACGGSVSGSTTSATATGAPGTCITTLNTGPGRWYRFIGNGQNVQLTTCNPGTNYDTKMGVFTGTCGALTCVTGNDDGSPGGGTDPACFSVAGLSVNRASTVNFASVSGTTYYVYVTGFLTASGNYQLTASCTTTLSAQETQPQIREDFKVDGTLNVGELFPNPVAGGSASIRINTLDASNAQLSIFDNMGRAVRTMETELYSGANTVELNLDKLTAGTYFVSIRIGNELVRRKLLIVRP